MRGKAGARAVVGGVTRRADARLGIYGKGKAFYIGGRERVAAVIALNRCAFGKRAYTKRRTLWAQWSAAVGLLMRICRSRIVGVLRAERVGLAGFWIRAAAAKQKFCGVNGGGFRVHGSKNRGL